jgi:hypothetical protein
MTAICPLQHGVSSQATSLSQRRPMPAIRAYLGGNSWLCGPAGTVPLNSRNALFCATKPLEKVISTTKLRITSRSAHREYRQNYTDGKKVHERAAVRIVPEGNPTQKGQRQTCRRGADVLATITATDEHSPYQAARAHLSPPAPPAAGTSRSRHLLTPEPRASPRCPPLSHPPARRHARAPVSP